MSKELITNETDVIILGAGASGLMCARAAARRGRRVIVLDHGQKAGRKVIISGGGHCNVTNLGADHTHYISSNPNFARSALSRFSPQSILEFLDEHEIKHEEREDGKVFLKSIALSLVNALLVDCKQANVEIVYGARLKNVKKENDTFRVDTEKRSYSAQNLVIATGGKSWKSAGATSVGYQLARQFGHEITELHPGLVPLTLKGSALFKGLSGISFKASVRTSSAEFTDDVLITHQGISGPAVLQASSHWKDGQPLILNMLPDINVKEWLKEYRHEKMELKTLLATVMSKRLAHNLAEYCGRSIPMLNISDKQLRLISSTLESLELIPTGTEGFARAEVTVGGVDTRLVSSKTMESQITSSLFIIGEVLDVTGELGGFNLHWAWVSARAAGDHL
ncbi:NAD(P)/FAD-dependent oxidoreductase [Nitrospirota bacterium]